MTTERLCSSRRSKLHTGPQTARRHLLFNRMQSRRFICRRSVHRYLSLACRPFASIERGEERKREGTATNIFRHWKQTIFHQRHLPKCRGRTRRMLKSFSVCFAFPPFPPSLPIECHFIPGAAGPVFLLYPNAFAFDQTTFAIRILLLIE